MAGEQVEPEVKAGEPVTPASPAPVAAPAVPAGDPKQQVREMAKEVARELALEFEPEEAPAPPPPSPEQLTWAKTVEELWKQANDPRDPRQALAAAQLQTMRAQAEDRQWQAIASRNFGGTTLSGSEVAEARQYYEQNRNRFADPYGAVSAWYGETAAKRDEQRRREEEAAKAAETQRAAAVGMPSRSVETPTGNGDGQVPRTMSVADYMARVASEPALMDAKTAGRLILTAE